MGRRSRFCLSRMKIPVYPGIKPCKDNVHGRLSSLLLAQISCRLLKNLDQFLLIVDFRSKCVTKPLQSLIKHLRVLNFRPEVVRLVNCRFVSVNDVKLLFKWKLCCCNLILKSMGAECCSQRLPISKIGVDRFSSAQI